MGFEYELYEAPDKKFGSMSEVPILIRMLPKKSFWYMSFWGSGDDSYDTDAYLSLECCSS